MKCKKIYRYKGYAGTEGYINFWLETAPENTPDKLYLDGRLITNIKKI